MDISAPSTAAGHRPGRLRLSLGTALLLAIWLGLCAGYLDLGVIFVKRFSLNQEGSYRSARDVPWTVPAAHVTWLLVPAVALAAWSRASSVSLRAGSWLLATLALWAAFLRLPFYSWSSLVLAFGFGKLFSDAVAAFGFGPRVGWVRKSLAGFVGLLMVLVALTAGRQALRESRAVAGLPRPTSARNVVFIVWDTVRASNLSLYGYRRKTTPNLERWATRGVRFNRPLAPSPWTYPSHASFFTGQWPFKINSQWKFALDTPEPTLAEFLAAQGYQTAGFAANTNCCNYETGLDRGFIHFEDYSLTPWSLLSRTVPGKRIVERILGYVNPYERKWASLQSRGAEAINGAFLGWLDQRRSDRPFFAFLNHFEAHEPSIPPPGHEGRFGIRPQGPRDYQFLIDYVGIKKDELSQRDLDMTHDSYDDCIAFLDEQLGKLLEELARRRILDDTVVIITSDHGEGFGEHNIFGHAMAVEIQEVGVPLVILAPGVPGGGSVLSPVSLRDIPATVADLLGLARGAPFPGRSLAEHWRGSAQLTSPALSEEIDAKVVQSPSGNGLGRNAFQMSLVTQEGFQYVRTGIGGEHIYNLWLDPAAKVNLILLPEGKALVGELRKMLLETLKQNRGSVEVEDAYLNVYRQELTDAIRRGDPPTFLGGL